MQNYSPATISVFSGLSYTLLSDLKSRKEIIEDKIYVGDFYCYLANCDNTYHMVFGFNNDNTDSIFNNILMIPLLRRSGTHYLDVKESSILEYLYNFFEHKTEYTFDAVLYNKVSSTIEINKRIRAYCEMISHDCYGIIKVVEMIDKKG
jgi:hypothetical protein